MSEPDRSTEPTEFQEQPVSPTRTSSAPSASAEAASQEVSSTPSPALLAVEVTPEEVAVSRRVSLSYAEQPERPSRRDNTTNATIETFSVRRSQSVNRRGRSSIDTAGAAIRRSLSMVRKNDVSGPINPLQEPRRSIGKRPSEYGLKEKDPHKETNQWWKHIRRAVPFAAPYARSGVVLETPAHLRDFIFAGPLTFGHGQWWYLVLGQGLVAAVISAAINFGVAVALYRDRPTIDIWVFDKQTVAGDMGVTVIIQQVVSFIITSSLVHHDLYAGPIAPLRKPWPPLLHLPSTPVKEGHKLGSRMPEDGVVCLMGNAEGKSKLKGWCWWFVRAVCTGSERNDLLATGISWRQRLERLLWTAMQGFFLCLLTFWWYWPLSIAFVAPIYAGKELAGTWVPMVIKLLFGGIMAFITNPIMALMAMGAESSVRRAYPELPIWQAFGGAADFEQWKLEHGVVPEEASFETPLDLEEEESESSQDTPTSLPGLRGSIPIQRRITEEPTGTLSTDQEMQNTV